MLILNSLNLFSLFIMYEILIKKKPGIIKAAANHYKK